MSTTSGFGSSVPVLELAGVFAEGLFALFAYEDHLKALQQRVVGRLLVADGAVEPFLAARRADRDLGVEDVFTAGARQRGRAGSLEGEGGSSESARRTTCWRRWGAAGLVAAGRCCCRRASRVLVFWCLRQGRTLLSVLGNVTAGQRADDAAAAAAVAVNDLLARTCTGSRATDCRYRSLPCKHPASPHRRPSRQSACTAQHGTAQHSTAQYSIIQHSTEQDCHLKHARLDPTLQPAIPAF